jgi:hypothetical protein
MTRFDFRRVATIGAAITLGFLAVIAQAEPSNKWRIKFNSTADTDGSIVLRIAPIGAEPIDVETQIPKGTSENSVASKVRDSLRAALGKKNYRIATDDGEDVLIKKAGKTPNFDLTLVSSSVTGVEIKLKHE